MGRYGSPRAGWWKDAMNMYYYSGGSSNNDLVQAVISESGETPNSTTLAGLNAFFNHLEETDPTILPLAEMIKFGGLGDASLLNFSKYNFVDPTTYLSTHAGTGDIIYGLKGWSSNGSSYINDGITIKRRPTIPTDCSSIVVTDAYNNASADQAACGSVSGNYYIMKPHLTGGGIYYLTALTAIAPILTSHNVFMSLSTNGNSGARARLGQNGSFSTFSVNLPGTEMTNDIPVFTCAYNNAGSPLRWYTQGNIMFRWEGHELSDAQIETIRAAWAIYYAIVFQTSWTTGDDITSDGREVWMVAGDSKTGTSSAAGRYANPNSVLQYRRSNGLIEEVKGADLFNIPSTGSFCPLFGRLYNQREASLHKRVVWAHYGISGSAFLNDFKPASWDQADSGTVYPAAKIIWDDALDEVGVTKPKGIVVILGINDMNETENIADTQTEMDNLIDALNTDYGTPPIYISIPSVEDPGSLNGTQLSRLNTIRAKLESIVSLNSNVTIFQDEATQVFNDPANSTDGSHFNYAGNEAVAQNLINAL